MKAIPATGLTVCILLLGLVPEAIAQGGRGRMPIPRIDVLDYSLDVTLIPEEHELQAVARMVFRPLERTETVLLEISENLSIRRVLDAAGVEILFRQDELGPGLLSLHFATPLEVKQDVTVTVEYEGGFDRDRYSRNYTRDESTAYIGLEGSYLLYAAKWFPINDFLVDRATATIEVTVPLGLTAVGPGEQLPVVTRGITEKFGWTISRPALPNTIVVGQFFERKVSRGDIEFDCFATEDHLDAIQKVAETAAGIVEYYRTAFGDTLSGGGFRLVEVDDRLAPHAGCPGTIFITSRELASASPSPRTLARRIAYQWWREAVGPASRDDLWLADGLSYYSAASYLAQAGSPEAFREELNNLAVLALKFESKSPIRTAYDLGYKSEPYESLAGGKGAWVLHMLRELLGDVPFRELLRRYLADFRGQGGSAAAFRSIAESFYGKDLKWFFGQWVDTTGVPEMQSDYVVYRTLDGFRITGAVTQDRDLFRMPLEVEVIAKGGTKTTLVEVDGRSTPFELETTTMPEEVVLDPKGKILRDSPELQIAVQLSLGMDLKDKENFVEAIRAFEGALKRNPRSSLAHFRMAEVFFEQFNLNAAADSFRNALNGDKNPPWTEVWSYIYLGKIFDILGQRQRALAEYNKALNTKDETDGAQEEAKKWLAAPYTREATTMDIKEPR